MADSQELSLRINGMHCGACVRRVTSALEKVPGLKVKSVEVGSASVSFDPAQAKPGDIVAAVNHIGFQASES